ncbi:MAG: 3-oxoadipate enol-lactonase [Betaproteobacteria bacterium]|jgi:3-oxoadipate enol-lactonase|nr:3-oxoadipate enol-lactonase [Betaproteobacteria bacterium]
MKTHYRVDGSRGPWVTFITGIANDTTMWNAQVPALQNEFRVLRYDLRGQGGSEATEPPYTIELLVDDLLRLWKDLKIDKSHLVGLGLGGGIAQAMAIEHGGRLLSVMPCCCRAQMVPDFAVMWRGLVASVQKNGVEAIVEPTAQRWFSDEFKARHPEVLDDVRKMIRRTSLDGYRGCVEAFLGMDLENELQRIRVPMHYLSGADDKLGGPPQLMQRLADRVPRARHSSVPKAAHIANIQNPGAFNLAMGEFIKEHS